MNWQELSQAFARTTGLGKVFQALLVASILTSFALGLTLLKQDNNIRVIVVPTNASSTFWLDDKQVSPEYAALMGEFILGLLLNVSPAAVQGQMDRLLKDFIHPEFASAQSALGAYADDIQKNNISQVFYPRAFTPDPPNSRVAITGELRRYVEKVSLPSETRNYLVQFRYTTGRVKVTSICQVPEEDKLALKPETQKTCTSLTNR